MKVLYHHRTQADDGQAVHIRSLIQAFEEQGHEVHEVGLVKHVQRSWHPPKAEAPGRSSWGWITRMPRFVRELAEYGYNGIARRRIVGEAARFDPDLIYERYAFGNASGILAAKRTGLPLILEVNSPMVLELEKTRGLSFPDLARKVERYVFREADRVCAVSGVLRDMIVEMGVEGERVFVTPNGVDLELYEYGDRAAVRAAAREDLGVPQEAEFVLGFVGYYRDWHRLDLVLDGMRCPELAGAHLVLIGEGPAEEALREQARAHGLVERIHFPGKRPHGRIPDLLPAFDAALLPAINPYASPLKLHEYMAAGLAVIGPDQENIREVLTQGENALLVPPGDAEALQAAMGELVADPELRSQLGGRARQTVIERDLTWGGNVRRVLRAFGEVAA